MRDHEPNSERNRKQIEIGLSPDTYPRRRQDFSAQIDVQSQQLCLIEFFR